MATANPYQQYQQNSITTANPAELTLMLYNGAIKFIKIAKLNIEQNNIQETHNAIIRAQNIIEELNNTLDMKYEISNNLRTLYTYILEKLIDANIKKETKVIDEILLIVEELRDTWKEAMKEAKNK